MNKFTATVTYQGVKFRVDGTVSKYRPAVGPSMSHAGGEPEEPEEVEISEVHLLCPLGHKVILPDLLDDALEELKDGDGFKEAVHKELDELKERAGEDYL